MPDAQSSINQYNSHLSFPAADEGDEARPSGRASFTLYLATTREAASEARRRATRTSKGKQKGRRQKGFYLQSLKGGGGEIL
jgi:hypothetical protein